MGDGGTDILFYSRDPGGTNAIVPICLALRDLYSIKVFGKDFAVEIYRNNGISCENILEKIPDLNEKSVESFLRDYNPSIVFTGTSTVDRSEYSFWKVCNRLDIVSMAYVDSWAYYNARFSNRGIPGDKTRGGNEYVFPTYILAVDRIAKDEMIEDGLEPKKIIVAGYWHFVYTQKKLNIRMKDLHIEQYRKNLCDDETQIILFLSEGFDNFFKDHPENGFGYTEKTIFSNLLEALQQVNPQNKYIFLIRPHPKEKWSWWEKVAEDSDHLMLIDNTTDLETQICAADLIVGMQTQCLNDAALIGKCVLSIQIGLQRQNTLFVSKNGIIETAYCQDDLNRMICCFFDGNFGKSYFKPRNEELEEFCNFIKGVLQNV